MTGKMGENARGLRSLSVVLGIALLMSVTAAGSALASPRSAQYDDPAKREPTTVVKTKVVKTSGVLGDKSPTSNAQSPQATSAGTLPFTGLDLVLIVGMGGALVAGGLVLRAAGRKPDKTS